MEGYAGPITARQLLAMLCHEEGWGQEYMASFEVRDSATGSGPPRQMDDILVGSTMHLKFCPRRCLSLFKTSTTGSSSWYPSTPAASSLRYPGLKECLSELSMFTLWPERYTMTDRALNVDVEEDDEVIDWTPAKDHLERLLKPHKVSPEEFHWRARCLCPSPGYCWTPETDKYWPLLFRKIIRCCLKIRVREGHLHHLPHDVVSVIGGFL